LRADVGDSLSAADIVGLIVVFRERDLSLTAEGRAARIPRRAFHLRRSG
jgi:hypothetical protein